MHIPTTSPSSFAVFACQYVWRSGALAKASRDDRRLLADSHQNRRPPLLRRVPELWQCFEGLPGRIL
jgi:hypothetical protein